MKASRPAEICFRPIGVVRNGITETSEQCWEESISEIALRADLLPALKGIEDFSHLVVIFCFHRRPADGVELQVHPERREDMPLVGVLATRSPTRPNPIGMTVVELLGREENILRVRGLDAFDGSPVLDIKPYLPRGDRVETSRVPEWLKRLWAIHDRERGHG